MATVFHRTLITTLIAALCLQPQSAAALGLIEAYEAAVQHDATYRAAVYDNQAGQQFKELGRANLLPNVSANYTVNRNDADIRRDVGIFDTTEHRQYRSVISSIQFRQPLVNLDGMARYRQGIAQTNYSDAQFQARSQELIVRLVGAYANAKYAEDQLSLVVAQRDALSEQRKANDQMFYRGEGTRTEMLETQAKFELAEAQVIEARDILTNARIALEGIVGMEVSALDAFSDQFRLLPMEPDSYEAWKDIALAQNPEISALRHAVESARQEINKNRAGHAPRLDAIASVSHTSSDNIATFNQTADIRSIGLQLTIPIYSGGSVNALTSQAVANHEKAQADLDAKIIQVQSELRKQFNLITSSTQKIEALTKSVESAKLLVEATQRSVQGGIRTNVDVLLAQQQLFQARRDLAFACYNYLLSYLRLRSAAGTIGTKDLQSVATYFVSNKR